MSYLEERETDIGRNPPITAPKAKPKTTTDSLRNGAGSSSETKSEEKGRQHFATNPMNDSSGLEEEPQPYYHHICQPNTNPMTDSSVSNTNMQPTTKTTTKPKISTTLAQPKKAFDKCRDERRAAERREANRCSAFRFRERRKLLIEELRN